LPVPSGLTTALAPAPTTAPASPRAVPTTTSTSAAPSVDWDLPATGSTAAPILLATIATLAVGSLITLLARKREST